MIGSVARRWLAANIFEMSDPNCIAHTNKRNVVVTFFYPLSRSRGVIDFLLDYDWVRNRHLIKSPRGTRSTVAHRSKKSNLLFDMKTPFCFWLNGYWMRPNVSHACAWRNKSRIATVGESDFLCFPHLYAEWMSIIWETRASSNWINWVHYCIIE
jgi:hypothetical protein